MTGAVGWLETEFLCSPAILGMWFGFLLLDVQIELANSLDNRILFSIEYRASEESAGAAVWLSDSCPFMSRLNRQGLVAV